MNQRSTLRALLQRPTGAHKYNFGHVLVIGGSAGLIGAPMLAAKATLRSGAGLVTVAAASHLIPYIEGRLDEAMTLSLPSRADEALDKLAEFADARKVSVLAIGPGMSVGAADSLVLQLLQRLALPAVVDAGALSALAGQLQTLHGRPGLVLTPHPGEYARLTGELCAQEFAHKFGITLVLKGHETVVAQPGGETYRNTTGNPGMATAGSGDVLAGVIAGLMAQHVDSGEAAVAGVYLHGLAGDMAAGANTQPGMIASDIIDRLPAAFADSAGRKIADRYE